MRFRCFTLVFLAALTLFSAPKKNIATAKGENEDLILTVTLYADGPAVKEALTDDLDGHYMVAEVKVEPKYGKEVSVLLDDFLLRSVDDGDKSQPFVASQIAGRTALIIKRTPGQGGGATSQPTYGGGMGGPMGYPGGGYPGGGYPGGYPSDGTMIGAGGSGTDPGAIKAEMKNTVEEGKDNPREKLLDDKILREKKTEQPVSGMLYFAIEKHKLKDMELRYGGKDNRITLRFNK